MSTQNQNNLAENDKIYFHNLDFLRFVACFAVLLGHGVGKPLPKLSTLPLYQKFVSLISNGGLAVSFFFVLSGFLITYLLLQEKNNSPNINVKAFYMRRALRIWPLYFFVVIFGFYIYPALKHVIGTDSPAVPNNVLYYFSFLTNFDSIRLQHLGVLETSSPEMLAVTWSVAIEEQFYLFWPLLFVFLNKKYFVYIFYFVILCSTIFRFFHYPDYAMLYFHSLSVASDLAMGGLFAYYTINSQKFRLFFSSLPKALIAIVYIAGISWLMFYNDFFAGNRTFFSLSRIVSELFFIFVIVEQNIAKHSVIKFSKFKFLSSLGKYTYGLYLLHPIGIQVMIIAFKVLKVQESLASDFLYGIGALVISIIMAVVSYTYFETPFLKLKRKFS
jgi:peptidoglycan/LPS O-acetylase OafA/YrhL